jgi:hypothetical protein
MDAVDTDLGAILATMVVSPGVRLRLNRNLGATTY